MATENIWAIVKILSGWKKYGCPATDTKDWGNTNVVNRNERFVPVCRHLQNSRIIMERTSVSWTVHRTAGSDTSREQEDRRVTFRHHSTFVLK